VKKIIFLTFLMFFIVIFAYSEEEQITFEKPEPYTDYEFEELQRTYLKSRKIKLSSLEKLPLNQYPEEFILELINMIKSDIRKDMYKEFSKYKKELLNLKPSISNESKVITKKEEEKNELFDTSKIITYNQEKQKIEIRTEKKEKQDDKEIKVDNIEQKKEKDVSTPDKIKTKEVSNLKDTKTKDVKTEKDKKLNLKERVETTNDDKKKDFSKENIITAFSINGDDPFIGINYLSKTPVKIKIKYSSVVKYVDIAFYVKNITDNMIYLVKSFPLSEAKETYSFIWESPSIPFGKYKPYIEVKFYDSKKNIISTTSQYWGNSSSNNIYVIFKN